MKVITVSRAFGSGGDQFAKKIADGLGFDVVDHSYLKAVEKEPEKYSPLICSIEDEVEPGFLEKVSGLMSNRSFYKTALALCVYELALNSDIVLVGAGGHFVLSGCPSLLSLQIVKKLSDRVRAVAHDNNIKAEDALKLVEERDKERSHFIKYYFDKELFDPLMFHFVVNGSLLALDEAVEMIATYAQRFFERVDPSRAEQFLRDRILEKKAEMVLFHLGMTHGATIEFEAAQGTLTVHGVVGGDHEKARLLKALGKMSEVTNLVDKVKAEVLSRNIY